jgi:chemotaxis family two-component system sensor kinase Cph1
MPPRALPLPLQPAGSGEDGINRWPAELTQLRLRLADVERVLRETQAELHDTRQRLHAAQASRPAPQPARPEAQRSAVEISNRFREDEQGFRLAGEVGAFGVWMCNADGHIEYVSQSFLDFVEMSLDQVRESGWAGRLPPDDAGSTRRRWRDCVRTGQDWEAEYRILCPEGQYHTILSRGKPVRNERGDIASWVGVNLDITARKKTEMVLADHVRELARSNAELEQFASVVSHDLRAPLTSIGGCAELLGELLEGRLDPETAELLRDVKDSVAHMGRLIRSLLAYSRVGKGGLKLAHCNVEKVLASVVVDLRAAIADTGARITHDPLPLVRADESLLAQLLQNLLENGIKYCGEAAPVIHVSGQSSDRNWSFSIRDNGIGIDPQHFEKIFLIFQRLHSDESRYPGLGVGLATCKKIVERHGGRIWVESAPGAGSVFHFSLPRPQ